MAQGHTRGRRLLGECKVCQLKLFNFAPMKCCLRKTTSGLRMQELPGAVAGSDFLRRNTPLASCPLILISYTPSAILVCPVGNRVGNRFER